MTSRARATVIRIVIALVVIGGIVWWFKGRSDGKSKADTGAHAGEREGSGGRGASGSASKRGSMGTATTGSDRVVPVQVATAEKKDVPIWLEGLGTVAAFQQVTVRAQVDGRLDKVLFAEGQP